MTINADNLGLILSKFWDICVCDFSLHPNTKEVMGYRWCLKGKVYVILCFANWQQIP